MLFYMCVSLSPSWRESFLRSTPLEQGVVFDRRVVASANVFNLYPPLKTL
jgi:hypothetical protein